MYIYIYSQMHNDIFSLQYEVVGSSNCKLTLSFAVNFKGTFFVS